MEDTRKGYEETVKAFRHIYNGKHVVFRGRVARRVQQVDKKITEFLEDLQTLSLEEYPHESTEIREHLFLRGLVEETDNS